MGAMNGGGGYSRSSPFVRLALAGGMALSVRADIQRLYPKD